MAARVLFDEGRRLVAEGQYRRACPKFEASQRLQPGIGTLFNLADCWEHIGRTASAWAGFLDAAGQARAAGQPDREQASRERATRLEPRLARLRIEVAASDAELDVRRDGVPVARALWALPTPADPGKHVLTASAPGKRPFRLEVAIAPGPRVVVAHIPELARDPGGDGRAPLDVRQVLGLAAGGVGLAGIGVGAFFGVKAIRKNDEASSLCARYSAILEVYQCSSEAEFERHAQAVRDAREARTLSLIGFVGGGAALTAGVILLWRGSSPSSTNSAVIAPSLARGQAGLSVLGTFR